MILAPELDENNQKIDEFDDTPNNFGRIAAATVRQVLSQRLRDAEDASVLGEFKDREGTLVSGVVQQGNNPAWSRSTWAPSRPFCPVTSRFPARSTHRHPPARLPGGGTPRPQGPSIVISPFAPEPGASPVRARGPRDFRGPGHH